ncbi:MAG: YlbE-like family protein [Bacillaceae bacterium]
MRKEVYEFIISNEDYRKFIREQPIWYRKLMRNPTVTEDFALAALEYYRKTIPHKVAKFQNQVSMASFMIDILQSMGSSSSTTTEEASD